MAATDSPSVFLYLDARKFLADACEAEKRRNPRFSHRYVARMLGASSSGFLRDVLDGRMRISPERAAKFAGLLGLTRPEAEHFETLVRYTQADSPSEKERLLARMTGRTGARKHSVLEAFQLEYFSSWRYAAVRELLALRDFRDVEEDHAALGGLLAPPIPPTEAGDAVRLLLQLGLARKDAQGRLCRVDRVVRSGADKDPARIRPALRDNLRLAARALEEIPPADRPFSYLTLSVSGGTLTRIRDRLADLRGELLEMAASDEEADRLLQVNFQMFPLSAAIAREPREKKGAP
jgi:uncharacterized protein (TIGR02147 family)